MAYPIICCKSGKCDPHLTWHVWMSTWVEPGRWGQDLGLFVAASERQKWSQTRLISGWHQSGLSPGVVQVFSDSPGFIKWYPYCPPTCPPVHAFAFVKRTLQLLLLPALLYFALLCFACCSLMTHCRLVSKLRWWVSVTDDVKIPNNHATNPKGKYSRNFCTESSSTTSSASPVEEEEEQERKNKNGRGG